MSYILSRFREYPYQPEVQSLNIIVLAAVLPAISNRFSLLSFWPSYSTLFSNYPLGILYFVLLLGLARYWSAGRSNSATRDLTGQLVVITGAGSGIGEISAIELAKCGANIIVGVRGQSRADKAAAEIKRRSGGKGNIVGFNLDLSHLQSVKEFVYKVKKQCNNQIDILINNAGVMLTPYQLTSDGFEMQFGTNHMGHFYLTKLLLPILLHNKARVINLSSFAHWGAIEGINLEQQLNKQTYNRIVAYGQSKLANIYFTMELARRYGDQGLFSVSLHPGAINTRLQRHMSLVYTICYPILRIIWRQPTEGAQTTLFTSLTDRKNLINGEYYADCRVAARSAVAQDAKQAEDLWELSEKLLSHRIPPDNSS
jgi:retinol dehydrogenase-12